MAAIHFILHTLTSLLVAIFLLRIVMPLVRAAKAAADRARELGEALGRDG